MLKVGLTGGIGSGKSTVARIFEILGVPVYYADAASKRLYHTDPVLKDGLIRRFGAGIYENDVLDRARLAAIVFEDPQQLEALNALVHPATIRDAREWMARQQSAYVIKEAALLFESGSVADLDYVIGVNAPLSLRIHRVMKRDGATRAQVLARMDRQIDAGIKMRLCDFVVENNEQELLLPQVIALHEDLMLLANS